MRARMRRFKDLCLVIASSLQSGEVATLTLSDLAGRLMTGVPRAGAPFTPTKAGGVSAG